jgi:hypothetical protein
MIKRPRRLQEGVPVAESPPEDEDLLAFIARMHQGDAMTQREAQLHAAVQALEGVHRQAAQSLQALGARGSKRQGAPSLTPSAPESPGPEPAAEPEHQGPEAEDLDVVSGEGREVALDARTLTHIVRPGRGRG